MSKLSTKEVNIYQTNIRTEFVTLKSICHFDELMSRSIRLADRQGYLLCISELYAEDEQLIAKLAN